MAKVLSLFDDDASLSSPKKTAPESLLPLIPLAKKKASKNDSPLEKEIRRFNKLIKEIDEFEQSEKKKKLSKEKYEQLYQQHIVPKLTGYAQSKLDFLLHLEEIIKTGKLNKTQQKQYSNFIVAFVHDATAFNTQLALLVKKHLELQVMQLSKGEKKQMSDLMDASGMDSSAMDLEDFDLDSFYKQAQESKSFLEEEQDIKNAIPDDVNVLYKELVKKLHPDLEQDASLKNQKHDLMQQLVKAKENNDLFAMLRLRAFVEQDNPATKNDSSFTLDQLKKFNKTLKNKLLEYSGAYREELLGSIGMNDNGLLYMDDLNKDPEKQVQEELDSIAGIIAQLKDQVPEIQTISDVKAFLSAQAY